MKNSPQNVNEYDKCLNFFKDSSKDYSKRFKSIQTILKLNENDSMKRNIFFNNHPLKIFSVCYLAISKFILKENFILYII